MMVSDMVWMGACGMSPFGAGTPRSPAMKVVMLQVDDYFLR
jgi:hypothetical protein